MSGGSWITDHGSWIMSTGSCPQDHGSWILDHGFWILDHGFWILFGSWIMDSGSCSDHGSWILDPVWIMDHGSWILTIGSSILTVGSSLLHPFYFNFVPGCKGCTGRNAVLDSGVLFLSPAISESLIFNTINIELHRQTITKCKLSHRCEVVPETFATFKSSHCSILTEIESI